MTTDVESRAPERGVDIEKRYFYVRGRLGAWSSVYDPHSFSTESSSYPERRGRPVFGVCVEMRDLYLSLCAEFGELFAGDLMANIMRRKRRGPDSYAYLVKSGFRPEVVPVFADASRVFYDAGQDCADMADWASACGQIWEARDRPAGLSDAHRALEEMLRALTVRNLGRNRAVQGLPHVVRAHVYDYTVRDEEGKAVGLSGVIVGLPRG